MQADPLFDAEVPEPLFPDEFEADVPNNDWGVGLRLRRIKMIEDQALSLQRQKKTALDWYDARAAKMQARIDREEQELLNYLKETGQSSVATPEGTAIATTRTAIAWPDDGLLLAWAKEQQQLGNAKTLVNVKESPNKPGIKTYIKNTGCIPEGYAETQNTSLSVRKAAK